MAADGGIPAETISVETGPQDTEHSTWDRQHTPVRVRIAPSSMNGFRVWPLALQSRRRQWMVGSSLTEGYVSAARSVVTRSPLTSRRYHVTISYRIVVVFFSLNSSASYKNE